MSYIKSLGKKVRKSGDKISKEGKKLIKKGKKAHNKATKNVKETVTNPIKAVKDVVKDASVRTVPKEVRDLGHQIDVEVGSVVGGKSAGDRAGGAIQGGMLGWQTGGPWGALGGALAGGAVGKKNIDSVMSGQGWDKGPQTNAPTSVGGGPGINIPASMLNTPMPDFGGMGGDGLTGIGGQGPIVAPQIARASMGSMNALTPPKAMVAAQMGPIGHIQAPDAIKAQQVALGGPSQYAVNQQQLIKALEGRAYGTAGPSLAELQLKKAQQDMINQMAAQAGSMSGRALPAAQRQIMQQQALSGQQLALDSAILRAQEIQQAEAQLAGALGQFRGQDLERTGLNLKADMSNVATDLDAQKTNYEGLIKTMLANQDIDFKTAKENLDALNLANKTNYLGELEANTTTYNAANDRIIEAFKGDTATNLKQGELDFNTQKDNMMLGLEEARIAESIRQANLGFTSDMLDMANQKDLAVIRGEYGLKDTGLKGDQKATENRQEWQRDVAGNVLEAGGNVLLDYFTSDKKKDGGGSGGVKTGAPSQNTIYYDAYDNLA